MHCSIVSVKPKESMERLKSIFPDGEANDLNFVLFSTSGVHGTYNTIEEAEIAVTNPDALNEDGFGYSAEITFLIVHPRTVTLQYGNVTPETVEDIEYLKKLRASSQEVAGSYGRE